MNGSIAHVGHLARRLAMSLSRTPPSADDVSWVGAALSSAEMHLWRRFGVADQRHSIMVARRFVALRPHAARAEIAAALLHDIGKVESGLSTFERVLATLAGPRTQRWRRYHDHERIGAEMLRSAGSDETTVALVSGEVQDGDVRWVDAAEALRQADDV